MREKKCILYWKIREKGQKKGCLVGVQSKKAKKSNFTGQGAENEKWPI